MQFVRHGDSDIELCVDDAIASPKVVRIIEKGGYERREMLFSQKLAREGERIVELGAGLGLVSTAVCKAVRPAYYAAVEADARLFPYIAATHERNGVTGVEVINAVFTTDPALLAAGSVGFGIARDFWASGIGRTGEDVVEHATVETVDLSAFVRDRRITMLVADIEGAELDIFRHLDFGPLKRVCMEIHPDRFGRRGTHELFDILHRNGFAYRPDASCGLIVSFDRIDSSK